MKHLGRGARIALVAAVSAAITMAGQPASAAPAPIGVFPTYAQVTPGAFDAVFPAAAAFPTAHVVSDTTGVSSASGRSAFLGASTAFGQQFGSTRLQPYLTIGSLSTTTASTTTVTFDAATPLGWGFALGDIDADYASITATGPGGPLTVAQLGRQGQGTTPLANYCENSPRPTGCGTPPFTDAPGWCPDPAIAGCAAYPPATVVGNGTDTTGAYDWFVPTVPVTSVTIVFTPVVFLPSYQLWLVAPSPAATVTGVIDAGGAPIPAGTALALLDAAGTPVPDIQGDDVLVPVATDGSFSFDTPNGDYQLDLVLPPGSTIDAGATFPFSFTAAGDTGLGTLAVVDPTAPVVPGPVLVAAGADVNAALIAGAALLAAGGATIVIARTRRSHRD